MRSTLKRNWVIQAMAHVWHNTTHAKSSQRCKHISDGSTHRAEGCAEKIARLMSRHPDWLQSIDVLRWTHLLTQW